MITIYTFEKIEKITTISEAMKEELKTYFKEIAEGIVGDSWQEYNLSEVGPILVIEKEDTIEVLDEYGLKQGSEDIPIILTEFAIKVVVDDVEMMRIVWVMGDSFGVSVYYPIGQFGHEFDEYIKTFVVD